MPRDSRRQVIRDNGIDYAGIIVLRLSPTYAVSVLRIIDNANIFQYVPN